MRIKEFRDGVVERDGHHLLSIWSDIYSTLCTGQKCPRYEATHRAQLLERRVQMAMANLAELGFEKVNIDKQIGQRVFVDLIHVASSERLLSEPPSQ